MAIYSNLLCMYNLIGHQFPCSVVMVFTPPLALMNPSVVTMAVHLVLVTPRLYTCCTTPAHALHPCIEAHAACNGSSCINGTKIFACYWYRVLGFGYLLGLKIFAVPFLPLNWSLVIRLTLPFAHSHTRYSPLARSLIWCSPLASLLPFNTDLVLFLLLVALRWPVDGLIRRSAASIQTMRLREFCIYADDTTTPVPDEVGGGIGSPFPDASELGSAIRSILLIRAKFTRRL
jgi:hypothetical protein